jgi:hypothetical protein
VTMRGVLRIVDARGREIPPRVLLLVVENILLFNLFTTRFECSALSCSPQ